MYICFNIIYLSVFVYIHIFVLEPSKRKYIYEDFLCEQKIWAPDFISVHCTVYCILYSGCCGYEICWSFYLFWTVSCCCPCCLFLPVYIDKGWKNNHNHTTSYMPQRFLYTILTHDIWCIDKAKTLRIIYSFTDSMCLCIRPIYLQYIKKHIITTYPRSIEWRLERSTKWKCADAELNTVIQTENVFLYTYPTHIDIHYKYWKVAVTAAICVCTE